MGHATFTTDQIKFRGRNDDVGLNSTTFNGGGGLNGDWTQNTDINFRVRFEVNETGGAAGNNQNAKKQAWK